MQILCGRRTGGCRCIVLINRGAARLGCRHLGSDAPSRRSWGLCPQTPSRGERGAARLSLHPCPFLQLPGRRGIVDFAEGSEGREVKACGPRSFFFLIVLATARSGAILGRRDLPNVVAHRAPPVRRLLDFVWSDLRADSSSDSGAPSLTHHLLERSSDRLFPRVGRALLLNRLRYTRVQPAATPVPGLERPSGRLLLSMWSAALPKR